ncbi:SDR family NAD(P)-dependent oxidoreductase [Streptomyces coelicoflavus]|uniref:SDR family NAD(P)-dependent oxidoreductase n=1 Tax=Streptomyces coelicoflavus TaxID=285562 RepID=UPI003A87A792
MSTAKGTALVTGASSGIGAAYARRLAAEGWDTVLVARRAQRLDDLARGLRAETSTTVETVVADLSAPDDLARVAGRAAGEDIGFVLNNAGINGYGPFAALEPSLLRKVLDVNVLAVTALARAAVPGMLARGRGTLVNVASQLAFAGSLPPGPLPERAVYAGSKGYVVTFTRTLAAELSGSPPARPGAVSGADRHRVPPLTRRGPGPGAGTDGARGGRNPGGRGDRRVAGRPRCRGGGLRAGAAPVRTGDLARTGGTGAAYGVPPRPVKAPWPRPASTGRLRAPRGVQGPGAHSSTASVSVS